MLGVLCIYPLMSLAFSAAFGAISAVSGDPFFQQGAADGTTNNYLYHSPTTITTVGMGDFTPATNLPFPHRSRGIDRADLRDHGGRRDRRQPGRPRNNG